MTEYRVAIKNLDGVWHSAVIGTFKLLSEAKSFRKRLIRNVEEPERVRVEERDVSEWRALADSTAR